MTSTPPPVTEPAPPPIGRRAEPEEVRGGRAWALLVAAVTLSMAASLIAVGALSDDVPQPAPAPVAAQEPPPAADAGAAAPAADPVDAPVVSLPGDAVAPPVGARGPQTVTVELETVELEGRLADGTAYTYWTFGGTVPGPMLRVREGDTVDFTLSNADASTNIHSIDLHAVNGPGGGAAATQVPPGGSGTFSFQALNPGVYVYHCATPHIPTHIANGMYGLIVVEPEGGLPPVDREFYVMQGEIYTAAEAGTVGSVEHSSAAMTAEDPTYVVFNGAAAALTGGAAMQAQVGETVRVFVGNGGPNLTSSFHVIGEVFDRVRVEGGSLENRDVQTTTVPAGGATWVEFTLDAPGDYLLVDHAISRTIDKGALAIITATGEGDPRVFDAPEATGPDPHAPVGDAAAGTEGAIDVVMTEFAFELAETTVPAGEVTFSIRNEGVAPHQFAIDVVGEHDDHLGDTGVVEAGGTVELSVDLEPGTYEIGCHIPGHYEAGMRTTITVT